MIFSLFLSLALCAALALPVSAEVFSTTRDPQTGRLVRTEQAATRPQVVQLFTGEVVGISDGDTIEVMYNGRAVKVRLHGIDTPEKAQAFGTKAKQFTADLVHRQQVTVEVHDTDHYGRLVAEVRLSDGRSLNRELVRAGMAWWYRQYAPKDAELARLEADARQAKLGLWSDPHAVAPEAFRHGAASGEPDTTPAGTASRTRTLAPSDAAHGGDPTVHTGPRGGRYTINGNGNKQYIPKK
jgi:endonuclease YncB( thermonuclease family)